MQSVDCHGQFGAGELYPPLQLRGWRRFHARLGLSSFIQLFLCTRNQLLPDRGLIGDARGHRVRATVGRALSNLAITLTNRNIF